MDIVPSPRIDWCGDCQLEHGYDCPQVQQSIKDEIFVVIKQIYGKERTKRGFNWIASKYGNNHNNASEKNLRRILSCITSKRDQRQCPVHDRVHDGKL